MLVTTRHVGEAIIINGNVEITVLAIKGGRVKLGTDAPRDVIIDRKEKWGRRESMLDSPFAFISAKAPSQQERTEQKTEALPLLEKDLDHLNDLEGLGTPLLQERKIPVEVRT